MNNKYYDFRNLSDHDLLTLTLREDSQVVTNLLSKISSIEELLTLTMQELKSVEGMKSKPAEQLIASMELAKRIYSAPPKAPIIMSNPQNAADFLLPQMRYLDREVFKCLYLNRKNHYLFSEIVSVGGLSKSLVHPREVFKPAIKRSAASVILAHNHPSGDPQPSCEDLSVTKQLVEAGNLLGIDVLDHIIIGDGQWISLIQEGLINRKD
jgi:DNA repair protein radc